MIDTQALASDCAAAARTRQQHAVLRPVIPTVHVITDLGPTDHAAILIPAQLGRITTRSAWDHYPINRCTITHSGPPCPGPTCTWPPR